MDELIETSIAVQNDDRTSLDARYIIRALLMHSHRTADRIEELEEDVYQMGRYAKIREIKLALMQARITDLQAQPRWIRAKDAPICVIDGEGYWECVREMPYGFIARIKTKGGWWIGHCTINDCSGLQGVLDGDSYDIGYSWCDVTEYFPITPPEDEAIKGE